VVVGAVTVTDATGDGFGDATVRDAEPETSSLRATIATVPEPTEATMPLEETVATVGSRLNQLIGRPFSTLPPASCRTAFACVVWPD
jgi:hypothetical protein